MSQVHPPLRARERLTAVLAVLLAACVGLAAPAAADSFTLDDLLERLAPEDGSLASRYVQTRESGLLTEEIRVTGEIAYESPGQLRKTEEDERGDKRIVHIAEGTVRIESEEGTRRFPVSRSRQLQALMTLLEAIAVGEAERLRERFEVEVAGTPTEWRMQLQARREGSGDQRGDTRQRLRVEVSGQDDRVSRIRLESAETGRLTLELDGDTE